MPAALQLIYGKSYMKTKIFNSVNDFINREDKTLNGVSLEFVAKYPNWEKENQTNIGCWDCYNCTECTYSYNLNSCHKCNDCYFCVHCINCIRCVICKGIQNGNDIELKEESLRKKTETILGIILVAVVLTLIIIGIIVL